MWTAAWVGWSQILGADGAKIMITADHGNAEVMLQPDGSADTAHSTDRVPLIVLDEALASCAKAQVWPTSRPPCSVSSGLPVPAEMTGRPLC